MILEPIMMNVGLCMPEPGFIEGLRELCDKHGALLIFDEVKTGAKLCWGGASEYFGVKPDMICLGKSIGGGFPLAAFRRVEGGHGPDLAAQGLSWRDLQHQSGLDGRGPCDVPRCAHSRQLRAHRKAQPQACYGLSRDRRQGRLECLHHLRRSQRRADVCPQGDPQLPRLAEGRHRTCGSSTGSPWSTAA